MATYIFHRTHHKQNILLRLAINFHSSQADAAISVSVAAAAATAAAFQFNSLQLFPFCSVLLSLWLFCERFAFTTLSISSKGLVRNGFSPTSTKPNERNEFQTILFGLQKLYLQIIHSNF